MPPPALLGNLQLMGNGPRSLPDDLRNHVPGCVASDVPDCREDDSADYTGHGVPCCRPDTMGDHGRTLTSRIGGPTITGKPGQPWSPRCGG